jgi:hypothetical protein
MTVICYLSDRLTHQKANPVKQLPGLRLLTGRNTSMRFRLLCRANFQNTALPKLACLTLNKTALNFPYPFVLFPVDSS